MRTMKADGFAAGRALFPGWDGADSVLSAHPARAGESGGRKARSAARPKQSGPQAEGISRDGWLLGGGRCGRRVSARSGGRP